MKRRGRRTECRGVGKAAPKGLKGGGRPLPTFPLFLFQARVLWVLSVVEGSRGGLKWIVVRVSREGCLGSFKKSQKWYCVCRTGHDFGFPLPRPYGATPPQPPRDAILSTLRSLPLIRRTPIPPLEVWDAWPVYRRGSVTVLK